MTTSAKTKPEIIALLHAVAAELGARFDQTNHEDDTRGNMIMPDGVKFFIVADAYGNKSKFGVSSSYPYHQHKADGSKYPTTQRDFSSAPTLDGINVSHSKTPAQIANDIRRRFLSEYEPLWFAALAYCQRQADYWAAHNDLAAVAAEVLKPFDYRSNAPARVDYIGSDGATVTLQKMDADKLRKLAAFLSTL